MESSMPVRQENGKRLGWLQITLIVIIAMVITVLVTLWLVKAYLFPAEFTPVALTSQEQQTLTTKLEQLDKTTSAEIASASNSQDNDVLQPLPYSEAGASRDVRFSERELNAMLANNTDLARRVAIDLSEDLISARILLPMDEDFPIFGGKTLRAKTGMEFSYENQRPVVKLRGVTIMGVPIPNAWLGGLKNIDLVQEFGSDQGFWSAFADGISAVKVENGNLMIQLKE